MSAPKREVTVIPFSMDLPCDIQGCMTPAQHAITHKGGAPECYWKLCGRCLTQLVNILSIQHPVTAIQALTMHATGSELVMALLDTGIIELDDLEAVMMITTAPMPTPGQSQPQDPHTHKFNTAPATVPVFTCQYCGKAFNKATQLRGHQATCGRKPV